jgi:hypothetical protein
VFLLKNISLPVQKLNYFHFYDICGYKNARRKKICPLFWCCYWIRDPGWIKLRIGIRDKHPGSSKLDYVKLQVRTSLKTKQ